MLLHLFTQIIHSVVKRLNVTIAFIMRFFFCKFCEATLRNSLLSNNVLTTHFYPLPTEELMNILIVNAMMRSQLRITNTPLAYKNALRSIVISRLCFATRLMRNICKFFLCAFIYEKLFVESDR